MVRVHALLESVSIDSDKFPARPEARLTKPVPGRGADVLV